MSAIRIYDVFSGSNDHDAIWQCSAEGLQNAQHEMNRLAATCPGQYFIFYTGDQTVVARIDTSARKKGTAA